MVTVPNVADSRSTRGVAAGACLRKAFSFPVFLGALLVAGVFAGTYADGVPGARLFIEGDTWWHITVGEHILATGNWPTSDTYSFTAHGTDWMAYEWLGEVAMALAARLGGLPALAGLLLGLAGTLLLLLYSYAHLRGGNVKAAFVACAALLPLAAEFFTLRPQLFGYIFLLITLICLERFRQGRQKALWVLPGVFLLWVNTHGTFVLGFLVLGLCWVSGLANFRWGGLVAERWTAKQRHQLAVVFLLCVLVLPLTPYGTRLAAYPPQVALSQAVNVANIYEWQPLPFDLPVGKLFLGLLLMFFLAQMLYHPTYRLEEMVLLLLVVYAACVHRRFALFFVLLFTPLLAALLSRWLSAYQPKKDRYALNAVLIALVSVGVATIFPSAGRLEKVMARKFPLKAVEYLRQHPVARPMLNEYGWGGYLVWSLGPEHKVFIDGRADIYEYSGVLSDYLHIARLAPDAPFLLRKYDVQACLLQRQAPLSTLLRALPEWQEAYTDKVSSLFVHKRRHPASGPAAPGAVELSALSPQSRPLVTNSDRLRRP